MTERARIALLRAHFAGHSKRVRVGIGDDAAVIDGDQVWTVDAQVEGTHFRTAWVSWEDVGWRSFMAAASDLGAMGAAPVAALSSLVLAPTVDDAALDALARGQAAAAVAVGAPIVGGNLARGAETSITTTLLGRASQPVLRSGARAGDDLWLAGPVGLAAAGLALLESGKDVHDARFAAWLDAWRRPVARIREGLGLGGVAHAAIDVSDGLAHDAAQLAEASGVCLVLEVAALDLERLTTSALVLGRSALDLALHGGEDYALLATSASPLPGFVRIGRVERGSGVVLADASGGTAPLVARGFDHFG